MFGEIVGIWIAWGRPTEWDMIELGPGRGTLMADVLRVLCHEDSIDRLDFGEGQEREVFCGIEDGAFG